MNFAFNNIFYLNNVSFGVDNVKAIKGTVMQIEKALINDRFRVSKVS